MYTVRRFFNMFVDLNVAYVHVINEAVFHVGHGHTPWF